MPCSVSWKAVRVPELPHDPDQIEQVLLNVVRNALQALGDDGGTIIIPTLSSTCSI